MECEKCGGTGVVTYMEDGYEYGYECECSKKARQIARLESSGLKMLVDTNRMDNFVTTESWQEYIYQMAEKFIKNPDGWFFIGGKSGAGKTHICTAICSELMKTTQVKYAMWRDVARSLKAGANSDDYGIEINKYKRAPVLYLDDFFKGSVTDADINIAFELINYRYNNNLTTLISSELSLGEITKIDEAIGGRIYQRSTVRIRLAQDIAVNYRTSGGKVRKK